MKSLLRLLTVAVVVLVTAVIGCAPRQNVVRGNRIRTIPNFQATHYHTAITLQVGWVPYEEWTMSGEGAARSMTRPDSSELTLGEIPVVFVTYPDSTPGFWLDPDVDDALLGKLIKHSLMTQVPISRPLDEFLEKATCRPCHPDQVSIRER